MSNLINQADLEQYILDHFDEALTCGFIKVYFQPIVRTLTRQICGMEALARWETPEYGMLKPDDFIGVLEKHRLIHKLDAYVIHNVCGSYNSSAWRVNVPVSVNLSALDYELCDIFGIVLSEVSSNKMHRHNLCIEITESALAKDEALMHQYIDKFRNAGFAVWMDDFGSGYSSLNVLKDFEFDELKIDMRFLSDFHNRSRKILASIIHMAKDIGIQTLAEGVETEEQFAFLHNIGCEKAQGFLFGKPMPYEECLDHLLETGFMWESLSMRHYYETIGSTDVLSASPFRKRGGREDLISGQELNSIALSIVEIRGGMADMLYANRAFEQVSSAVEWPPLWSHHTGLSRILLSHISRQLQKLLEEAKTEGFGRLLSVYDNDYYEIKALRIAECINSCAVIINITNLSRISSLVSQQQLDEGLRSLYSAYDQVLLINLDELTMVSLHLGDSSGIRMATGSLLARIEEYCEYQLYPDDRERFRRFINPETLEERASHGEKISIHLREITFHGDYAWKAYQLVRIRQNMYYLLIRSAEQEVFELKSTYQPSAKQDDLFAPDLLWENAVNHAELKFFWKDRDRRFVGVSQSFLDYYSLESESDIVGRTDEDMGWHIRNDPFRDEEWKVLNEGITSRHVEGNCLVQGENREIIATKMPLFSRDGKIIGLIGTFRQAGPLTSAKDAVHQARTDALTGLLNSRGLHEDLFAYIDEYQLRGRDFARIEVSIDGFEGINSRYGYDFGDSVIRETGRALLRCCGNTATVGRMSGCYYTVLRQFEDAAELEALVESIRKLPEEFGEINGVRFSMYLSVGMALYSESEDREIMTMQAEMRRNTDNVETTSRNQLMINSSRIFHMFDEFPMGYAVCKLLSGPEGSDVVVLYANPVFLQMTQNTPETLAGMRLSSSESPDSDRWISMALQAGVGGKTVTGEIGSAPLNIKMTVTAYPIIGPGFCAFVVQY